MSGQCVCTVEHDPKTWMVVRIVDQEYGCPIHGMRTWCRTCGRVTVGYPHDRESDHDPFDIRVKGVYATKHPTHPNDPYARRNGGT